jgi:hypothetical protein
VKADYEITGLHYLFWNTVGEEVGQDLDEIPGQDPNEFRPTYDIFWSSEAADKMAKMHEEAGISFYRIDYPIEALRDEERRGLLGVFAELTERQRVYLAHLFFKNISAERRWRQWLKEGRPQKK